MPAYRQLNDATIRKAIRITSYPLYEGRATSITSIARNQFT